MGGAVEIGRQLGVYVIERKLGEGGMGAVYAARHERIGRRYAIKVLLPELATRPEALARFEREARALSALGHPNIVQVHDFAVEADGTAYLVMDLLEGMELSRALAHGQALDPARARRIAMDIASGLGAAHRIGLVHRDLKPSNVFLVGQGERERAVLLDFGLAKALAAEPTSDPELGKKLTASGMILGTPHYMSPEQAQGSALDARTDVWTLGVVLYEMMTGRLPFDGPSIATVFAQILTADPATPTARGWRGPSELEALAMRCLARDREARPRDGDAVLALLEGRASDAPVTVEIAHARTVLATPATPGTPVPATRATPSEPREGVVPVASGDAATAVTPPATRTPGWAWGLLAVTLVAIGAGGAMFFGGAGASTPASTVTVTSTITPVRALPPPEDASAQDASTGHGDAGTEDAGTEDAGDAIDAASPTETATPVTERSRHARRPPPPAPPTSETAAPDPASLVGRVPPGMESTPGARELVEAGELMQNGDWAGCLRVLSHAPQTQHILSVEMSCANNAHDRPALTRVCSTMRQRFPQSLFNQTCATLLSMPP